jgi:hypothetical protein
MNIFEQATRQGFRFSSKIGLITTEDLWALPLTSSTGVSLDGVARQLHKEIQASSVPSFVEVKTESNSLLEAQIEVVKHIIAVKLEEKNIRDAARETAAKKQRIMELIQNKKDAALADMSIEELEKML